MVDYVDFARVRELPEFATVDTVYFVQPNAGDPVRQFITGDDAVPVEIAAATAAQQLFDAGLIDAPTVAAMSAYLQGPSGTLAIGTVTTGAPGSAATVTNVGTPDAAVFDITLPRGTGGPAATVTVGTVTTGAPGSSATVTNAGTSSAAQFNFTIPRGADGEDADPIAVQVVADDLNLGPSGSFILRAPAAAQAAVDGAAPIVADALLRVLPEGRNIFKTASTTIAKLINGTSGAVVDASARFILSDYIYVAGATSLSVNYPTFGDGTFGYVITNAKKERIAGGTTAIVPGTPLALPAGSFYIRMTWDSAAPTPIGKVKVWTGSVEPADGQRFNDPEISSFMFAAMRSARLGRRKRGTLVDRSAVVTGKLPFLVAGAPEEGTLVTANAFSTVYIPVEAGFPFKTFPASDSIGAAYGVAYYGKNGAYISGTPAPFAADQVFTPPGGAVFAAFPFLTTDLPRLIILDADTSLTPSVSRNSNPTFHSPAFLPDASAWAGLNLGFIGDSITAALPEGRWVPDTCARLNANFAVDAGRGGRKMAEALNDKNNVPMTQATFANIDLVNIYLGVNDYVENTPIGTLADPATAATYIGYTKKTIEQLLTWNPTMLLLLTTLLYKVGGSSPNTVGARNTDYSQAIRDVAGLYSLAVHDLERTSGISAFNASSMLYDGLHPNASGLRLLSGRFTGFIGTLAPNTVITS